MMRADGLGLLNKSAWWVASASGAVKFRCTPTLGRALQRAAESRTNPMGRAVAARPIDRGVPSVPLKRLGDEARPLGYRPPPGAPTECGLGTSASRRRFGSYCIRCRKDPYVELVGLYGVTEKLGPRGLAAMPSRSSVPGALALGGRREAAG
mmetsp:Transcript_96312/g.300695  ORF Transcript_96312/g.300695 Transcript_96312/m.300695 type:complete len:152 (+) Transcript_96312:174-629(+)